MKKVIRSLSAILLALASTGVGVTSAGAQTESSSGCTGPSNHRICIYVNGTGLKVNYVETQQMQLTWLFTIQGVAAV